MFRKAAVLPLLRRSALTVFASVLLMIGLISFTSTPSQADDPPTYRLGGHVLLPTNGGGIPDVAVRIFRATDDPDNPWMLQTTTHTSREYEHDGYFEVYVPAGTYRIAFNDTDDGGVAWRVWQPLDDGDTFFGFPLRNFVLDADHNYAYFSVNLKYRGGLITGTATDQCGSPVIDARVEAYDQTGIPADFNQLNPDQLYPLIRSTDSHGNYSIPALNGPTKLHFWRPYEPSYSPGFQDLWLGDSATIDSATTVTVAAGDTSPGHNIELTRILRTTGASPTDTGTVVDPEEKGIPNVGVSFYRSTTDRTVGPWALEKTVVTGDGIDNGDDNWAAGYWHVELPVGVYRAVFNDPSTAGTAAKTWSTGFNGPATSFDSSLGDCNQGGEDGYRTPEVLHYRLSPISGRLTDLRGAPAAGATVEAYDADDTSTSPGAILRATTNANGEYSIHGVGDSTKLRFSKTGVYLPEWSGDATTFATAEPIATSVDTPSAGNDAVLADAPIRSVTAPVIRGSAKLGTSFTTTGGTWAPYPVTLSYQWFRKSGTTTRPISGAKYSHYLLKTIDLGKVLSVRVTASPKAGYPGIARVIKTSASSPRVRRGSSLSISSDTSGHKIKVTIRVKITGISGPDGKVTVSYSKLKQTSYGFIETGTITTKRVSYTNGKATLTINAGKGWWGYGARLAQTSTVFGASDSDYTFIPE